MDEIMDIVSEVILEKKEKISKVITEQILDELIYIVLDVWHKNPEIEFDELRKLVIEKMEY